MFIQMDLDLNGKIIAPVGTEVGAISKGFIMNVGDYYRLQYTIASASPGTGEITIQDGWDAEDIDLPKSVGTHNVLIKAGITSFIFKRNVNPCDIWLSSISLKKVL